MRAAATRRVRALAAVPAAVTGALAAAAPAGAFEPVEGVWKSEGFSGGAFLIQQKAPGVFRQVTIDGRRDCVPDEHGFFYLVGNESEMRGGGLDYFAANTWRTQDCAATTTGVSIYRVISTQPYRMASCAARSDAGPPRYDAGYRPTAPNTYCTTAVRIRAPQPPAALASFVTVARAPRCTPQARRRGRSVRIRLSDHANEPVFALEVRLGRRVVYRYDYPGTLSRSVAVRLPARRSRLSIAIKTTSNKSFVHTRRFSRCARARVIERVAR